MAIRKTPTAALVAQYRRAAESEDPWPKMAAICLEMQRRGEAEQLLTLLSDPDLHVRQWGALMALHFAPDAAVRALEEMIRGGRAGASIILGDWRAGRVRPLTMGEREWVARLTELRGRKQ